MRTQAQTEPRVAYEDDFCAWLLEQAAAIRAGRWDLIDVENLAEEVEGLARLDKRELRRHLRRLLLHLLKFWAQPKAEHRHNSWRKSVRDSRYAIQDLVRDSSGIFAGRRDEVVAETYARARRDASDETRLTLKRFPAECPWTWEEIMRDFMPLDEK